MQLAFSACGVNFVLTVTQEGTCCIRRGSDHTQPKKDKKKQRFLWFIDFIRDGEIVLDGLRFFSFGRPTAAVSASEAQRQVQSTHCKI